MDKDKDFTGKINEGEGNRTAAREYNEAQQQLVHSGKVEQQAHEAERDLLNREIRRDLERVEMVGKRHAAAEDPELKRR